MKILVVDFNDFDIYDRIKFQLEMLPDIDVLVNDVGAIMSKRLNYFVKTDADQLDGYFNVNMYSYMKMTKLILPKMVEKKRGVIISISSLSGVNPAPFLVVYSASKLMNNLKATGTRFRPSQSRTIRPKAGRLVTVLKVKIFSLKTNMNSFDFQQKHSFTF